MTNILNVSSYSLIDNHTTRTCSSRYYDRSSQLCSLCATDKAKVPFSQIDAHCQLKGENGVFEGKENGLTAKRK